MNPTGEQWDLPWDPRLCVNSLSSQHWTLSEDLECYERLGIGRISLFMPKLRQAGLDRAEAEIKAGGFRVDGILPGSSFDLLDEASWSRTRDALVLGIEVAQRLGATTVQTSGGTAGGWPYEVAVERFARAIAPVAAVAEAAGIRLALEATRPQFAHIGFTHTVAGRPGRGGGSRALGGRRHRAQLVGARRGGCPDAGSPADRRAASG